MKKLVLFIGFVIANLGLITSEASATPVGTLNLANCAGQGVTVTQTTVVFAGNCVATGAGTSVATSFGTLLPNITGTIANLPVTPAGNPFMTFIVGGNNLNFFLTGTGPGVNNTVCAAVLDPNLPSCSIFAGSPFILVPGAGGTTVRFDAHGSVPDGTGTGLWNGTFSADFANQTPLDLRNQFIALNTLGATTFSGSFAVTSVPEPLTLSLLSVGLLGVGILGRRKARRS